MKPCDRWRDELADRALGACASPALAAHLAKCPACSAALAQLQARACEIDDGIRQLVASELSANAAARILAQVESRAPQRRSSPRWKTAAAAFAALVILAVWANETWKLRERREETVKALSAAADISNWRSPTQDLLRSPYDTLLKGPPRLGEYFYELKPGTLKMEHYAPRAKERENP